MRMPSTENSYWYSSSSSNLKVPTQAKYLISDVTQSLSPSCQDKLFFTTSNGLSVQHFSIDAGLIPFSLKVTDAFSADNI